MAVPLSAFERLNSTVTAMESSLSGGFADFPGSVVNLGSLEGASDINAGWMLTSGYLVFFMQAGFAMLCAGAVRAKNAKNIILLNLLDACLGCVAWYLTGFAFAYGDPAPNADDTYDVSSTTAFIGHRFFAMSGLPRTSFVSWFFQFTFAATAATIVSGAVAERCRFECYMLYELILVLFVYPVVVHWVWTSFGWASATRTAATSNSSDVLLFKSGVYDFAGDGPVHMIGGLASLAGAWILGPRLGRFDAAGNPVAMPGHSAALNLLGVFFLWFGWYGFNPGSTGGIVSPGTPGYSAIAASVAVNTTISAASATLSTLFIAMAHQWMTSRVVVWDLLVAGNGALAGLVSITGAAHVVEPWAAFCIGIVGGAVLFFSSRFVLLTLKVDDPLDAIAVHAAAGIWGMLAGAAFAAPDLVTAFYGDSPVPGMTQRPYGFIMGGDGRLLGAHLVYILAIVAWVLGIMTPFFFLVRRAGLMRVSPEWE
ncbi:ammonium transporter, partial [Helicosporidium sp. ATCC 50920]